MFYAPTGPKYLFFTAPAHGLNQFKTCIREEKTDCGRLPNRKKRESQMILKSFNCNFISSGFQILENLFAPKCFPFSFSWGETGYHIIKDQVACRDEYSFMNPSLEGI